MQKFLNKKYIIIGSIVVIVIIGLIINNTVNTNNDEILEEAKIEKEVVHEGNDKSSTIEEEKCYVKVDIKGYVNKPGLYQLECDKRVADVINMAGGLKKNADTSVINLGKKIFDQMVIIIYSNDEVKNFIKVKEDEKEKIEKCVNDNIVKNDACIGSSDNSVEDKENVADTNKKVSLNNATKEELMTLTGIGESKALDIISYRTENNGFKSIEEIMNISGIGEKAYEKIKDNLTL